MERYKCRLCFKSFVNGRALGGHMRSHMLSLSAKRGRYGDIDEEEEEEERPSPLSDEIESGELLPSSSVSYSTSSSDDEDEANVGEFYGSRENAQRSVRVPDREFAFAGVDHGYVLLQDGESETESTRASPTRRRSKRTRKLVGLDVDHNREVDSVKRPRASQLGCMTVPEPLSSGSDTTTTEEDLAFCLMMLSRDNKWKQKRNAGEEQEGNRDDQREEENDTDEYSEGYNRSSKINRAARGRYKCETCDKVFKSYQALGGHRASHKKNKVCRTEHVVGNANAEKKTHECPICLRVFPSGQALGGHKRSHGLINLPQNHLLRLDRDASMARQRFIDLNLPAPTEDDETCSQAEAEAEAEASAVFDEC